VTAHLVVDGVRLEAAWWGDRRGPTLVLLHEGLGSVSQWRDWPARLAAETGLGAFAYSRAGYGGSDAVALPRPLDYMEVEARSLPAVLGAAGIDDAILVGHSDGASIAIASAGGAGRERVRGLVLLAPHVFVETGGLEAIADARVAYEQGDLRERLARHHGDNVDVAFRGWNDAWLAPGFRAFNLERYLPAIAVPTVVVQGDADPYGTLAQVAAIERGVPGARRVVLAGCGHAPHRERPDETTAAVAALAHEVCATGAPR
jgi:pimeloyl-ACP methyl ester carboxylesterase